MAQMTDLELHGVFASAQSMYEREHNLTYRGELWEFKRDRDFWAAGMLARVVAGECMAIVHDNLNDGQLCDPIETLIEQRFGMTEPAPA